MFRSIQLARPVLARKRFLKSQPYSLQCRSFHTGPTKKPFWDRNRANSQNAAFSEFFRDEIEHNVAYKNVDPLLKHALAKESYLTGRIDTGPGSKSTEHFAHLMTAFKLIMGMVILWGFYEVGLKAVSSLTQNFPGEDKFDQEYLVEKSTKDFSDVKGMPEILAEFELVVDLIKNKAKYDQMGAKLPRGILLNGPPGTGKTLIAKAIAGEAGVPFLYASGSQFDEMYVGVGAKRMRKLFSEARAQAPCIIFMDEIDAVGGKRKHAGSGTDSSYARMTINQLLQEMDGLRENENIIVIGATNLKQVIDPALLRPGRFDLTIDVPFPNKEGREEILRYYFGKVKEGNSIDIARIADISTGFSGAQLANIVNQAAIRAVRENHNQVDVSDLEFAFDKITMGPELKSMTQNDSGERKTAVHEGGHCLLAYLLHKKGLYDSKPRKATITRRGGALGHVSFMSDEKSDESSTSLQHLRAHLIVSMGGRAAEAIFNGEDKVCTGAASDMDQALRIAREIVCNASAGNQVKGRKIELDSSSEKKREEVDSLIDNEIEHAYTTALKMLTDESVRHNLLIDALCKYKTLDSEEIDVLLTTQLTSAVETLVEEKKHRGKDRPASKIVKKFLNEESKIN